jgi:hypothetical protein
MGARAINDSNGMAPARRFIGLPGEVARLKHRMLRDV